MSKISLGGGGSPGPGQYDINPSFETGSNIAPKFAADKSQKKSNRLQQGSRTFLECSECKSPTSPFNVKKMSVPSIPSRYLTPVIDIHEMNQAETEEDVCKVIRVKNDPSIVGPGSYNPNLSQIQKTAHSVQNWNVSRSSRQPFKVQSMTAQIGPGDYHKTEPNTTNSSYLYTKSSFAKEGLRRVIKQKRAGSIRDNFEFNQGEEQEDETSDFHKTVGPGSYKTETTFSFKQKPESFQFFGSSINRFDTNPFGSELGPGQYKIVKPMAS